MPLKFDADGDLAFASGQELRDGAKDGLVWLPGSSVFILIDGRGIRTVEKVEDFEQAADADAVANPEGLGEAHIHVQEVRRDELIPGSLQIAAIETAIAILIQGHKRVLRVVETTLRTEEIADFDFPRQLEQTVGFEGVPQGKVGRTVVEFGAVIEDAGLGNKIPVRERASSVSDAQV